MPSATEYFLSARPAFPWSEGPLGLPALLVVAGALVAATVWTYTRHPAATRRRVSTILALRLAALVVALLTAVRPSVGIQEDPKVPSTLLVGVDLSESMTIKDEIDAQRRIDAVRKVLARCEPILDELRTEQNVNVVLYGFGRPGFDEAADKYTPERPADAKRSDYGCYLNRTFDRWQGERFVRGHYLIGDGADNGTSYAALAEAARWRTVAPVSTFAVGSSSTPPSAKDVAVAAVSADPAPVPIKNDVSIKAIVNAYGFAPTKVPVRVYFTGKDGKEQLQAEQEVALKTDAGNEVTVKVKAPDTPGEVRVRVEIPADRLPGDVAPANNSVETYMTVTKEGVRVLYVDRMRTENTLVSDVLGAEKRFDVVRVLRQRDDPATAEERELFDFDSRAYDVIVLGNVSARQLAAIDPNLMTRIREQVLTKGTGLLFTGGDASFLGTAARPLDNGFRGTPLEELLPVSLTNFPPAPAELYTAEDRRFQTVPTLDGLRFLLKVGPTEQASQELWDKLNGANPPTRLTAVSKMGNPKPGATVYAVATDRQPVMPAGAVYTQLPPGAVPLLVGTQFGDRNPGRVLAFAGYDTFQWKPLGMRSRPRTREGIEIHAQFWRRLVLWLAKQEEDEGAAFARPEFRRLAVNGKQSIRVGLRQPGGADAVDPQFQVRVVGPGQKPEEAQPRAVVADPAGGRLVAFEPPLPGEYTVLLTAAGKDAAGKELKGEASARFLAYAETSDELLRAAADTDFLEAVAKAGGGKPYRLEDLPSVLREQKAAKIEQAKKPRFVPDWRRNHSGGFLPGWLVAFVALVGAEWVLRRLWGMV
jgi:hypothetical protein